MNIFNIIFLSIILTYTQVWCQTGFNELTGPDGFFRPQVQSFINRQNEHILSPSSKTVKLLTANPLGDKIKILPFPLIIDNLEYTKTIVPGVRQRARALKLFFYDIVLGNSDILKEKNIFNQEFINNVFLMEGLSLNFMKSIWKGKSLSDINLVYGPDLVRNSSGNWVIIEDNTGSIGGTGDITAIGKIFFETTGLKRDSELNFKDDLTNAILMFLSSQNLTPESKEVIAFIRQGSSLTNEELLKVDLEDERRTQIVKKLGIRVVDPNLLSEKELEFILKGGIKSIINFNIPRKTLLHKLKFFNAFSKSKFTLFQSPGVSVISNKALLPYVEYFIKFYLNEVPILKTQPSEVLFDWQIPTHPKDWVIKKTNSLQGRDIFILQKYNKVELQKLQTMLDEKRAYSEMTLGSYDPLYIKQHYLEHSYLPSDLPDSPLKFGIDIRPITYLFNDLIVVSETPWGRSAPKTNYALNNVSQGAYELVVIRENSCKKFFENKIGK